MPYRLYALSNAGSMFALLSYPVLFEPVFTTHQQAVHVVDRLRRVHRCCAPLRPSVAGNAPATDGAGSRRRGRSKPGRRPILPCGCRCRRALRCCCWPSPITFRRTWRPFRSCGCCRSASTCLSFILCFEGSGWYRRNPYLQLLAVALGAHGLCRWAWTPPATCPSRCMVPLFSPGPVHLLHGLPRRVGPAEAAPAIPDAFLPDDFGRRRAGRHPGGAGRAAYLQRFYEMPIGLVVCAVLIVVVLKQDPELKWFRTGGSRRRRWQCVLTVALAVYTGHADPRIVAKGSRVLVRNFYGALQSEGQRARHRPGRHPHPDPRHHQSRRGVSEPDHAATCPPLITGPIPASASPSANKQQERTPSASA